MLILSFARGIHSVIFSFARSIRSAGRESAVQSNNKTKRQRLDPVPFRRTVDESRGRVKQQNKTPVSPPDPRLLLRRTVEESRAVGQSDC